MTSRGRRRLPVAASCALLIAFAARGAPGDWPEPRQNPHLTAYQPLPGRMKESPVLLARYDLGRSRPRVKAAALPDNSGHVGLSLVAGALLAFDTSGKRLWECHPPGLNLVQVVSCEDLDGDGTAEIALQAGRPADPYGAAVLVSLADGHVIWRYDVEPMSYSWFFHIGDYLADTPAKEIVVIMHGYPPDKANGYMVLFEFLEKGQPPVQKWRYDFSEYTCFPSLLETDLEGDGVKELVVETHSRMWLLDAPTGAVKSFVKWDVAPASVRSYGLVEFVDLDKDGGEDFLCIANFAQHHEVLLKKDGKFEKAWSYGWPESVTTGKVATTWPEPPYADVDGDGQLEIIVSMFNSENEGTWLTRVYDAVTGTMKYRAPGVIATSVEDLDDDGVCEILANASKDPTQAVLTGARILKVKDKALAECWQDDTATAVVRTQGRRRNKKAAADVARGGAYYTVFMTAAGEVTETPWTPSPESPAPDFSGVPALEGPPAPALLAVDVTSDGQNDILLYSDPDVQVLSLTGGVLEKGKRYQSSCAPTITDLDGDGHEEVVVTSIRPETTPVIEAKTPALDDKTLWTSRFPEPGRLGLPQPRKAYVRTGRFTGKSTPDLYVWAGTPVVRSVALDGRTGQIIWEKGEVAGIERYWGPSVNLASVHDYDGDGNEDLVFTNPDYYCVASGTTGRLLLGPLFPPNIFSQPSQGLYTCPAILSKGQEIPTVCLVAGHYFQAAMSVRAEPRWYRLPAVGENRCGEEGFLQLDDGAWLMGFARQNGYFSCVNISDGSARWELPLDAAGTDVASCDVDGDGRVEFIFGTSHKKLYAVGDEGGQPRIVWTLNLSGAAGPPIAADVNGDGASEVVLVTADGYLNVFGVSSESSGAGGVEAS